MNKDSLQKELEKALSKMIPKIEQDFIEIQKEKFIIHVISHPDGKGHYEIEILIPHETIYNTIDSFDSSNITIDEKHIQKLSNVYMSEIENSKEIVSVIENSIENITTESDVSLNFNAPFEVSMDYWDKPTNRYGIFPHETSILISKTD